MYAWKNAVIGLVIFSAAWHVAFKLLQGKPLVLWEQFYLFLAPTIAVLAALYARPKRKH